MIRVELHRKGGKPSLWAAIDDADAVLVGAYRWYPVANSHRLTHAATWRDGRNVYMHTIITGWPFVDHKDCDGLNNQRSNLRPSNHRLNGANRRPKLGGSSLFKGVAWHKSNGKWIANIRVGDKLVHLGYYTNESDAARAYDNAALAAWGEHARLNIPKVS